MGGINCNNPRYDVEDIDPRLVTHYTEQLAVYCRELFKGSAKFFEANVAIEDAVIRDTDLLAAIQFLDESQAALEAAQVQFGSVAAVWSSVRAPEIDFGEQQKLISTAIDKIAVARMELQALIVSGSLQQSLWRDETLTNNFVDALNSLTATTQWQGQFAQAFAVATLTAS